MIFVSILISTVSIYLSVLTILLFLRVLYPLIFASEESIAFSFIFSTTEPVMLPIRDLLDRSETFSSLPVDFSCLFATMGIMIVRIILAFFE